MKNASGKANKLEKVKKKQEERQIHPDDMPERRYKAGELLKRTFKYLLPYLPQFIIIIFITIVNSFLAIAPIGLLGDAIRTAEALDKNNPKKYDPSVTVNDLYFIGIMLIIYYVAGYFLTMANSYFHGYISQHTTFDLRQDMYMKLQELSFSYYDKRKAGKIMSRVMNDVGAINSLLTNGFPILLGDFIKISIILYMLFSQYWQLTLLTLTVGPAIIIFSRYIGGRARRIYRKSRMAIAEVYTKLEQGVAGMKTIKAFTREDESRQEFDTANRANMETNIEAGRLMASVGPIFQAVAFGAIGLVFIAAFFFLRTDQGFNTEGFVEFMLLVMNFYGPIQQLAGFYNQIQAAVAGGERIFSVLDADVEVKEASGAITDLDIKGDVEFKNVNFYYQEGVPVLHDINIKAKPKESVAIVGYTGAGKTTIINLLCRFYDPVKGQILIDGVDLKDLSMKCLRSQLGIVLQHPFLFTDTVMENIRYGSDVTDEEVIAVAKQIGAHEFIMDLEKGYDTGVRERGVILSQGQRQLISFARALMANPKILILDEATSSLDSYSEMLLQKAIEEITKNRTSFIIAHRLSTIRNAGKIVVIDKGRIIEVGDHEELIEKDGLYAKLYKLQFRDIELLKEEGDQYSFST
ncbi:MAG: ABC transporter ATP-binding protein [Candidatus Hodarchaeota archaeon]